jgi:hypothetical protein
MCQQVDMQGNKRDDDDGGCAFDADLLAMTAEWGFERPRMNGTGYCKRCVKKLFKQMSTTPCLFDCC